MKKRAFTLAAALLSLGTSLMLAMPQSVYAAAHDPNACSSNDDFACVNYNGSSWNTGSSVASANATIDIKDFKWEPNTKYPIKSKELTTPKTSDVVIKVTGKAPKGSVVTIKVTPNTEILTWDNTYEGFKVKGGTNTDNLVLVFKTGTTRLGCGTPVEQSGATFTGPTPLVNKSDRYGIQVCVTAYVTAKTTGDIILPDLKKAFDVSFGGVNIGQIFFSGKSSFPAPKVTTCEALNSRPVVPVDLGRHSTDAFLASPEVGNGTGTIRLKNCPSNSKLSLVFTETPTGLSGSNNAYLVNQIVNSTGATGVGIKLYYNGTTDVFELGKSKVRQTKDCGSNTLCDNDIVINARLYRISNTQPVTAGKVEAKAILTIGYE